MAINLKDELIHYGIKRRSGRYPWGSGKEPFQRSADLLARIDELRNQNITFIDDKGKKWTGDTAIAKTLGLTTTEMRIQMSLANDERRAILSERAQALREKGLGLNEITREMGYENDSSIRSLLNENSKVRMEQAKNTAAFLKEQIDSKGMIDVGSGVERELNISPEQMKKALYLLEMEGYEIYSGGIPQATNPTQQTIMKVIGPPGTEHKEIYNFENVHHINDYVSRDGGDTFSKFEYPASLDGNRVMIRYAEEGGLGKDGLVELRRGVEDISLGESHYSQVRILVDNDRYIKGMAVYSDDIPAGYDVVFNTNKSVGTDKRAVLKEIKNDPENPFGSLIKAGGQSIWIDANGKEHLRVINKRADEGDWADWDDKLPSQFLSKQNLSLIKRQLKLTHDDKLAEFNEIQSLNNPTVKKALLQSFADDCDAAAVHLKAAALPGQKFQVIIPVPSLKDTEAYAPNFPDGSRIALVRFPHGGTFEIPELTVNNKQRDAMKVLTKNPKDAIGINSKVAERLSGADFDGDTVMVIPLTKTLKISTRSPLQDLVGFDAKHEYGPDPNGIKVVGKYKKGNDIKKYYQDGIEFKHMSNTQTEMGKISNLITDMTIKGATEQELARAVKHSMVVIDAEKHHLNYKKSERVNGIAELKKTYQGSIDENGRYHEGASTLISRAKSQQSVLKRKGTPKINIKGKEYYDPTKPEGALIYNSVVEEYVVPKTNKRTGQVTDTIKVRTQVSTKMAETSDARKLSSGYDQEEAYASYANQMKALANKARVEMVNTGKIQYSKAASKTYEPEARQLESALKLSLLNKPKERSAQLLTAAEIKAKKTANPDITEAELKKARQSAITKYRNAVGAQREKIEINNRQWEAIQAGAISENKLKTIIDNADIDKLRALATPRTVSTVSQAQINKIKALHASGHTNIEIARAIGKSPSTISKYLTT